MTKICDAIISIRPKFAEAILSGTKSIELRRRIPPLDDRAQLWIYATRPTAAIVGAATVQRIIRGCPSEVWQVVSGKVGVSRAEYDAYFDGSAEAIGLVLTDIVRGSPISIEKLRIIRTGFHPPQVIARITKPEAASITKLSKAVATPGKTKSAYKTARN